MAGDEKRAAADPCRPSELDVPRKPDLRCLEHGGVCEVIHSLHGRVVGLEQRVRKLEEGSCTTD